MFTSEQVLGEHSALTTRLRYPAYHVDEYMKLHVATTMKLDGGAAAGHMFWPLIKRSENRPAPDIGERLARLLGGDLFEAETIQVTAVMMAAMRDSAANLEVPNRVDSDEIPFPCAFTWLDDPWELVDVEGTRYLVRVVTWRIVEALTDDGWHPGVRTSFWAWLDDDLARGRYPVEDRERILRTLGDLQLLHTTVVPLDHDFDRREDPRQTESTNSSLIMLRVLWTWLGMEITDTTPENVPRQAAKRARRHLRDPRHTGGEAAEGAARHRRRGNPQGH
jgi:hypothetical protein